MADEMRSATAARDEVGRSGIYPASGPRPAGEPIVRGQGELGHPDEIRAARDVWARRRGDAALLMAGRLVFGGYFVYNGINHFLNREMLIGYARSKGVPMAGPAVVVTGAMMLLGGLSLITGVRPKLGASFIASFLLGVSPRMHDFWAIGDEQQRSAEMINFTKNMALVGAAAMAAAIPEPWPAGVPAARQHR